VQSGSERFVVSPLGVQRGANSSRINDSVMELLIMISACKGGSAKSVTGTCAASRRWYRR
jgi:phosphoribosylpyrophosphate synthetase